MNTRNVISATLFVAATATTSLILQACGGGIDAVAQTAGDVDPIEGTWESVVSIRDCASGAVVRSFKGITLFHRGGGLSGSNSVPSSLQSGAFGGWKRATSGAAYSANFRFFRFNPDGSLAGSQRVTRTIALAMDGNSLTGTISGQVLDTADAVVQTFCGTETTTRLP